MSDSSALLEPDKLFVVACPVCQGQVAATGSLCGHDACCPLCASLFHVPFPPTGHRSDRVVRETPQPEPAGIAEDWGRVITQLAPPKQQPDPAPLPATKPAEFELQTAVGLQTDPGGVAEITGDGAGPAAPADQDSGSRSVEPAGSGLPTVGGTPQNPKAKDLVFTEPVRTVRHGDTVIEIRRLTPEERRVRRFRRNVMMIVVGVSILLAIVMIFGVPDKKP